MSALLTTTMPYMKVVIDTLKEKNLREKYIVLVGGAPLNEEFGKAIGADAYCRRRGHRRRDRQAAARRAPRGRSCSLDGSSSPAARSPTRSRRCARQTAGPPSTSSACLPSCTTGPRGSQARCARRSASTARTTTASSSPTATAVRAGRSTRCSPRKAWSASRARIATSSSRSAAAFAALAEAEPGTFYLTDFLLRHFDRLVIQALGIDRHPELQQVYFGNYRRLVYLAQAPKPDAEAAARKVAERLGLELVVRQTGYGALGSSLAGFAGRPWMPAWPA